MNLNKMTYIAFAAGCAFLAAQAAEAKPRQVLTAENVRELMQRHGNSWVRFAEKIVKEKALAGEEDVTIKGKPCRTYKAMLARGFRLDGDQESCTISWREENEAKDDLLLPKPSMSTEPEEEVDEYDTLSYRMPR